MRNPEELQVKARYDAILASYHRYKKAKNLTLKDLDRRIAQEVVDHDLHYYESKSFDKPKPDALKRYDLMSQEEKYQYNTKFPQWREMFGATEWQKEYDAFKVQQDTNSRALKEWLGLLKDDESRFNKLNEFMLKQRVPEEVVETAQRLVNTFGGRVVRQWED